MTFFVRRRRAVDRPTQHVWVPVLAEVRQGGEQPTTTERLGPQQERGEREVGPGVGAEIDVHMRRVGVECSVSGADVEPCR